MKKKHLEKNEIDAINLFVQEAIKIPVVEGIYIVPYQSLPRGIERASIVTVFNKSARYNGKITGIEEERDVLSEINKLVRYETDYNLLFLYGALSFRSENVDNYNLEMMSTKDVMAERSLVSGTILFDRFGELEKNKQMASEILEPFNDIIEIDNIDTVIPKKIPALEFSKK